MVAYLAGIYKSTSNQVTKSAWGNIVGLSMTDLRAMSNLTSEDIAGISGSNVTYSSAVSQGMNQFKAALSNERLGQAGRVQTLADNLLFSTGLELGSDPTRYIAYKMTEALTDVGGKMGNAVGEVVSIIGLAGNLISIGEAAVSAVKNVDSPLFKALRNLEDIDIINAGSKLSDIKNSASSYFGGLLGSSDISEIMAASGSNLLEVYQKYENIVNGRGILFDGTLIPTTYADQGGATTGISAAKKVKTDIGKISASASAVSAQTTQSIESIIDNSERIESQAKTIVDSSSTAIYDISNLYDALFVNQIAMKVKLADYDEAALQKLASVFSANSFADALRKILDGSISVDLIDTDTNSIVDSIMKVRGF